MKIVILLVCLGILLTILILSVGNKGVPTNPNTFHVHTEGK